jgi:LytS/YehU family sensor histidine kinase
MSFFFAILLSITIVVFQWWNYNRTSATDRKRSLEMELKLLSYAYNPHFIHNSLNSVKNLVLKSQSAKAGEYLSSYAALERKWRQNIENVYNTIEEELNALLLYIDFEKLRFKGGFDFTCYLENNLDKSSMYIPGFFIQPLIEKAIWNGLNPDRHTPAILFLGLATEENMLKCTIRLNADSRDQNKIRHSTVNIQSIDSWMKKRISIFNKIYPQKISIRSIELLDEYKTQSGLEIILMLPINYKP